ncbi:EAL/GGDEF domain-containing protein [Thauera sp. 28]|uniref:putative bifunctional diguanylate cyclase/phosphodiesterase n=1 Tax=Thauera sp. 28 TaxID=303682 RepID=UPI0002D0C8FA|nr:GGDEF domain-containing response regulator [Thauera sp. 28]ENO93160.1 EAL/GGDEF domain-containing protein [Thauera sp. 28]
MTDSMGLLPDTRAPERQAPRLLIVDDCEDDALLVEAELARRGMRVSWRRVDEPVDMAAALAADEWDLVLCDQAMPAFDCRRALQVLQRSGKDVPFVVHSGSMSAGEGVGVMYEGARDFVPKGDFARLLAVIERERQALSDRSAVRHAVRRIRELSLFDHGSMLPNKVNFLARVADWMACRRRGAGRAAAAMFVIDVDQFMRVNLGYGYGAGSEILLELGRRLAAIVPAQGVLARLEGDLFGVFVPGVADEGQAEFTARWLLRAVDRPFASPRGALRLTASVGIVLFDDAADQAADVLTQAELALAECKRAGGNQLRIHAAGMSRSSLEAFALELDLRAALEREEFRLHYQPIVGASSCHARGAEALLRWQHPVHGLLEPDRFVPIADRTGLIVDIGGWVLAHACLQGARWRKEGVEGFEMSVNVSAVQFARPGLLAQVECALAQSGFPPSALILEITESSLMSDTGHAEQCLRALKTLGVRIAIDDFGTGYSSLAYLRRLPIDVIKIDRELIGEVDRDNDAEAIVRAALAMAHSLRLKVVAEGVETAAQEILLQASCCDSLQGFRYGRPAVPAAFRFGSLTPDR